MQGHLPDKGFILQVRMEVPQHSGLSRACQSHRLVSGGDLETLQNHLNLVKTWTFMWGLCCTNTEPRRARTLCYRSETKGFALQTIKDHSFSITLDRSELL